MWEQLLKVHQWIYGDWEWYMASDYKNIGTCQLAQAETQGAIESFLKAVMYCQYGLDCGELSEDEWKEELA